MYENNRTLAAIYVTGKKGEGQTERHGHDVTEDVPSAKLTLETAYYSTFSNERCQLGEDCDITVGFSCYQSEENVSEHVRSIYREL